MHNVHIMKNGKSLKNLYKDSPDSVLSKEFF